MKIYKVANIDIIKKVKKELSPDTKKNEGSKNKYSL